MNSSGIKRGLATTAVSALAVAGIPFIASSASAATGDSITVASVGPIRNGGDLGGKVLLQVKGVANPADLKLIGTNLTSPADTPSQTLEIVSRSALIADKSANDSNPNDGLDEIVIYLGATTPADGGSFSVAVYEDETGAGGNDKVDAAEPRATISGSTAGAPATISVSPTLQSAPVGVTSGKYTVSIKDSSGNATQLETGESIGLSKTSGPTPGTLTTTPGLGAASFAAGAFTSGSATFTASGSHAGLYGIGLTSAGTPDVISGSASLDVSGEVASGITQGEVDVVTGADTREGFDATNTAAVSVRPDQSSVTINIKSPANAGKVVTLTSTSAAAPNAVTFGGKDSLTSPSVSLNADGVGSVTIPVDASSIQDGDKFSITGSGVSINVTYAKVAVSKVDGDSTVYLTAYKGTTSATAVVTDQYGNPVSGVFVTYQVTAGPNAGAESARVQTGADGKATFSIVDSKATAANNTDSLTFKVYAGQFDSTALANDTGSSIKYSADGTGADFLLTVDGQTPGGAAYNPVIQPLTDTVVGGAPQSDTADSLDESAELKVNGGTAGAPVTVTADNGGLVLTTGTTLGAPKSTATGTPATTFYIVGTKAGVVNVTVASGGKSKTATVTVKTLSESALTTDQAQAPKTARNIAIEGPSAAVAGNVVEYTVTITDAFGNPVKGFDPANGGVNTLLTGPATIKGNSGKSNAAGEIVYTVELAQDAKNPLMFKVTGTTADFGAAADRLTATSTTDDGKGLSASVSTASVDTTVTNLDDLEQAVEDAKAALAAAEANLASAQADLDVAQAELAIAQANVDSLTAKKQSLRQKLNKAKAKGNKQKAKTTRKKLRNVKRNLSAAKDNATLAQAKVDARQTVVDLRQDQVDAAQADLDEAEQNLEDAQG